MEFSTEYSKLRQLAGKSLDSFVHYRVRRASFDSQDSKESRVTVMTKDGETSSITSASTVGIDPNLRAILDVMQKQNERHEQNMSEMRRMLSIANEENKRRVKEIEILGKNLADIRLGVGSATIATTEFDSLITEDEIATTVHRAGQNTGAIPRIPNAPPATRLTRPMTNDTDDESAKEDFDAPRHNAKTAVQFIPILKGRDDIGVEGFIKKVRKARARCREQPELLDLILSQRITEDAERSIRHLDIESYTDLYDALRKFVSIPTTADSARDRPRTVRQGPTESVHSYTILSDSDAY